jgi:hypothetical protein
MSTSTEKYEDVYLRNVLDLERHEDALRSPDRIAEIRRNIQAGDVYIARNLFDRGLILKIRDYLRRVGQSSLPNYHPIAPGCPNFHRMNAWDERAYVKSCFHQFAFFPWNQDLFALFRTFRPVYHMKNLVSGLPAESFLGTAPEGGCVSRLAFQFYPRGGGAMNRHRDPVDHHQLTVPIMIASQKGDDFHEGGAFVERRDGSKLFLDDVAGIGDVVYFNAQTVHGVESIDPQAEMDWSTFEGRWMLLFAVNKVSANDGIANSLDLGPGPKA